MDSTILVTALFAPLAVSLAVSNPYLATPLPPSAWYIFFIPDTPDFALSYTFPAPLFADVITSFATPGSMPSINSLAVFLLAPNNLLNPPALSSAVPAFDTSTESIILPVPSLI